MRIKIVPLVFAALFLGTVWADNHSEFDLRKRTLMAVAGILDDEYSSYFQIKAALEACDEDALAGELLNKFQSDYSLLEIKVLPGLLKRDKELLDYYTHQSEDDRVQMIFAAYLALTTYSVGYSQGLNRTYEGFREFIPDEMMAEVCAGIVSTGQEMIAEKAE